MQYSWVIEKLNLPPYSIGYTDAVNPNPVNGIVYREKICKI